VNESEKYAKQNGWKTTRHKLYPTTDNVILNIEHISVFYNFIINKIKKLIMETFNISAESSLHVYDAFIVKYEAEKQNELEIHTDSCDYTVNIALSEFTDYEGGGVYFENINQTVSCEIGDMLIHYGYLKHAGMKITKGKRYVLVTFLKL
jgi:predicted 2-oxoglutarate/Fe(II)-dependent dioxygenase YbiX